MTGPRATIAAVLAIGLAGALSTAAAAEDATRIVVLGDTGTGEPAQYRVMEAFMDVCARRGCDLAIITGDLVYERGVSGPDDPQLRAKFEQPYADVPLTFYLTLGNHDAARGDAMVAYHPGASGKWHLPARFYHARVADVDLFSLDTNAMTGDHEDALRAQAAWIGEALAQSGDGWKIAFGHHPLYSNGEHGDAGAQRKALLEERVCGKVDFYLSGHDHVLQWLKPKPSCGATELIVSGAGARTRELEDPHRNPARFQRGGTLGFWWIELRADSFTAAAYDGDGELLYEGASPKPLDSRRRATTRRSISSRTRRKVARSLPFGSSRSQSTMRLPTNAGHASSPQPIVTTRSHASRTHASSKPLLGSALISIPRSRMTCTASGSRWPRGRLPPLRASTLAPPY